MQLGGGEVWALWGQQLIWDCRLLEWSISGWTAIGASMISIGQICCLRGAAKIKAVQLSLQAGLQQEEQHDQSLALKWRPCSSS